MIHARLPGGAFLLDRGGDGTVGDAPALIVNDGVTVDLWRAGTHCIRGGPREFVSEMDIRYVVLDERGYTRADPR